MDGTQSGYPSFAKIPRLYKPVVITEKIDGTNALIAIDQTWHTDRRDPESYDLLPVRNDGNGHIYVESPIDRQTYRIRAGSRKRWIGGTLGDNYGFAAWVAENAPELVKLGPGLHYGEWFGKGINRGYGLEKRRFALFNVGRWHSPFGSTQVLDGSEECPECCTVVPVLGISDGEYLSNAIDDAASALHEFGSYAVPDYRRPEGLIVYHTAAGQYFKVIFEGGNQPKSALADAA